MFDKIDATKSIINFYLFNSNSFFEMKAQDLMKILDIR